MPFGLRTCTGLVGQVILMRRSHSRADTCLRGDGGPKTVHRSRQAAQRQAERLGKVWRTGRALKCYPCEQCGGWHIGRSQGRRKGGGWK